MELVDIAIYPIKSTAAIRLEEAQVEKRGLSLDRRWMIVDQTGLFITQRKTPKLALIKSSVQEQQLRLEAPGQARLEVPLRSASRERLQVKVWQDQVPALLVSSEADAWLSAYLGTSCHLVWMGQDCVRPVDARYSQPGDEVSFADGMPLLLTNTASLAALNERIGGEDAVPMDRFRPNIVVEGAEAFAEDDWKQIQVGSVVFDVVKPCSRCVMITIDQETAAKGKEPLATLSNFRQFEFAGKKGVFFGQNLVPRSSGLIRRGDKVRVLSS